MKHIFVINPSAGQGQAHDLIPEIDAVCSVAGVSYEIYETTSVGDAQRYVAEYCAAERCREHGEHREEHAGCSDRERREQRERREIREHGEHLRFYACGGDGTLNEVVNGAFGYDFAEVGFIPAGSGNDFIRNFPDGRFDDLIAQIKGQTSLCDLIHYEGEADGEHVSRYCVNMFNVGFDSNVVDQTARMKRLPLVTGSLAYLMSVAAMLIRKKGADLRVEYEQAAPQEGTSLDASVRMGEASEGVEMNPAAGGFVYDGKLLLIAVANGAFCGGGIKGIPRAVTDDGVFDVSLVKNVSRLTFVKLFPKYMSGTHLGDPRLTDVIRYTREKSLTITPNPPGEGTMKLCVDGEITKAGKMRFTICPKAFRFIIPR